MRQVTLPVLAAVAAVLGYHAYKRKVYAHSVMFLLLAATPFAWYFLMTNHSFWNWFFTYRNVSVAVYALATAVAIAAHDLFVYRQKKPVKRKKRRKVY